VDVSHGRQDLAAAGQADPARKLFRLRDRTRDEEEGQRYEQDDEQRAARLLAKAEPRGIAATSSRGTTGRRPRLRGTPTQASTCSEHPSGCSYLGMRIYAAPQLHSRVHLNLKCRIGRRFDIRPSGLA
jgi:hypothetical protein